MFFFHASIDPEVLIECSPVLGIMDSTLQQPSAYPSRLVEQCGGWAAITPDGDVVLW